MIVRARSPLFIFHALASVLTFLGFGILGEIKEGLESFLTDPRIQNLWDILIIACPIGLVIMLTLGIMELAIRRGWDPQFLKVRLYGAQILRIERPSFNSKLWTIVVIHPDGEEHSYMAEEDEVEGMEPGDYYRLDVFGKHIVGLKFLEKALPSDPLTQTPKHTNGKFWNDEKWKHYKAWLLMIFMFPLSGHLIGTNLLPLYFREDVIYRGRRYSGGGYETLLGDAAIWSNAPVVALGVILIIVGVYYWVAGWNKAELSYRLSGIEDDLPTKSRLLNRIWSRWH